MNQKITKLVRQALNECVSNPVESVIASRIDDHGIVEIPNTFSEKFAELIVQECVNILDPNGEYTKQYTHSHTPGPDGLRTVLSQEHYFEILASNKIRQHFGVQK